MTGVDVRNLLALAKKRWPALALDVGGLEESFAKHYPDGQTPFGFAAEDFVLASAVASGNKDAWEIFYREYSQFVLHIARRQSRNDSDAEEIAQDFCGEEAPRRLRGYAGRCSLRGWLAAVAPNVVRDWHRRRAHEVVAESQAAPNQDGPSVGLDSKEGQSREEAIESVERASDRSKCEEVVSSSFSVSWEKLKQEERAILEFKFLHGLKSREIGKIILRVREDVVSKRLKKAVNSLGRSLRRGAMAQFNFTAEELRRCVQLLIGRMNFRFFDNPELRQTIKR